MPKTAPAITPQVPPSARQPAGLWRGWSHLFAQRRWRIAAVWVVIALAVVVRFVHLGADPPPDASWSQDLLTDPPQYTAYARNAHSFGDWNPLGDPRLVFFQKNVTGICAWIVFALFGPGIASANLTAVLLNLTCVGFLAWAAGRAFGFMAGFVSAWLLAVNYLFVTYSRQPFLEVASNTCLAFAFWAVLGSARRWWWAIVAGLAAGVGIFFGKVTALHAAPALLVGTILTGLTSDGDSAARRWKQPLGFVAGSGIVGLLWYWFAYRPASAEVFAYLKEQSYSLYGSPLGFSSIASFLDSWLSLGIDTKLLTRPFMLGVLGLIGMAVMLAHYLRSSARPGRLRRIPPAVAMLLVWFWSGWLAFSPFNYRPVRYQIVLMLPLAVAAGWLVQRWVSDSDPDDRPQRVIWWAVAPMTVVLSLALTHFVVAPLSTLDIMPIGRPGMIAVAILLGLVLAGVWVTLANRRRRVRPRSAGFRLALEIVAAGVLLFALVHQGRKFVHWWSHATYGMEAANRDLAAILGPDAVVTGEWASPLTQLDGSPKGLTHYFSLAEPDGFFARYPITHVAVVYDEENSPFFKDFPQLAQAAEIVTVYVIRGLRVVIFRIAELSDNPQAKAYRPSFFERLLLIVRSRPPDSLLLALSQVVADSADSFSGWILAGDVYSGADSIDAALGCYRRALAQGPDDFVLLTQIGDILWKRFGASDRPSDRLDATRYWNRALELSPGNAALLERLATAQSP